MMKEGDYIVRIWPSRTITMGKAVPGVNGYLLFESLENYSKEGGVKSGFTYGYADDRYVNSRIYRHRLATPIEIKLFLENGKLEIKEDETYQVYRESQLNKILMIHKDKIERYNGSTDELIEDIGNLKYDALADFLQKLSIKLDKDAQSDLERGRRKLSNKLLDAANNIELASLDIDEAWEISEPFEERMLEEYKLKELIEIISKNGYIPHIYSTSSINYEDIEKYLDKLVDLGKIRRIRKWRGDGTEKFRAHSLVYSGDKRIYTLDFEESYTQFELGSGGIKKISYGEKEYDYIYSDEYESVTHLLEELGPVSVSTLSRFNPFRRKPEPPSYNGYKYSRGFLDPVIDPSTDFRSNKKVEVSREDKILAKILVLMIKDGILKDSINLKGNPYTINTHFMDAFSNCILEFTKEFERDKKLDNLLNNGKDT